MAGLSLPFHRTYRPPTSRARENSYITYDSDMSEYIEHDQFAKDPDRYIRAFLLIQKDLDTLFGYIEPADANRKCYSHRLHELLLRACIEVEVNCRAILFENGYTEKPERLKMPDYKKLNATHRLSSYEVDIPYWDGTLRRRRPFSAWDTGASLPWYDAYNATKHDRHESFRRATFWCVTEAVCGLVVILSAQFHVLSFVPGPSLLKSGSMRSDGFEPAIGGFFNVRFPNNWSDGEKYDFTLDDWKEIKGKGVGAFQKLSF